MHTQRAVSIQIVEACGDYIWFAIGLVFNKTQYSYLPHARRFFDTHLAQAFPLITRRKKAPITNIIVVFKANLYYNNVKILHSEA